MLSRSMHNVFQIVRFFFNTIGMQMQLLLMNLFCSVHMCRSLVVSRLVCRIFVCIVVLNTMD